MSNLRGGTLVPSLPCRNRLLVLAVKTYEKADMKVFWLCPIFHDFLTFCEIFCSGLCLHQ